MVEPADRAFAVFSAVKKAVGSMRNKLNNSLILAPAREDVTRILGFKSIPKKGDAVR